MQAINEYLAFIIPIAILELVLTVTSIIHVIRHPHYRFGNKALWIVVSFLGFIGPIIYFVFGRGEE